MNWGPLKILAGFKYASHCVLFEYDIDLCPSHLIWPVDPTCGDCKVSGKAMAAHGKMVHDGRMNTGDHKHNTEHVSLVPSSRHRMFATTASENRKAGTRLREGKKNKVVSES